MIAKANVSSEPKGGITPSPSSIATKAIARNLANSTPEWSQFCKKKHFESEAISLLRSAKHKLPLIAAN